MPKTLPFHPFLFAIFPVLFLFSRNVGHIPFAEVLGPLLAVLTVASLLLFLTRIIFRDFDRAGMVVSFFLILFFSYGHFFEAISSWVRGALRTSPHEYLFPLWCALFIFGFVFLLRVRLNWRRITKTANIISLILVILPLINIGVYSFGRGSSGGEIGQAQTKGIETENVVDRRPDIYYIIFDRYASASVLKEIYDFDNSEFLDYLSGKGFYVAADSQANYFTTSLSLASSLNLEYINYLGEKFGEESGNWLPVYALLQDYKVWRFLKGYGYEFIHFGSWWQPTYKNNYADLNFNSGSFSLPEFSWVLYKTTFLPALLNQLSFIEYQVQRERILYKFEKLAEISDIEGPTFTFAHMLLPHGPYIFDRNGDYPQEGASVWEDGRRAYVDQLIFANRKIRELVDSLLARSKTPPVIILQADEGPHPPRCALDPFNFNWEEATAMEIKEKGGILNAYYLPGTNESGLYPFISPANSFRLIFNLYFNTDFKLLPDESYGHISDRYPYKFLKITEGVD